MIYLIETKVLAGKEPSKSYSLAQSSDYDDEIFDFPVQCMLHLDLEDLKYIHKIVGEEIQQKGGNNGE